MNSSSIVSSISNNSNIDSQLSHQSYNSCPPQLYTNTINPQQHKQLFQSESDMNNLELHQPLNNNNNGEEPQTDNALSSHFPLEPTETQNTIHSQVFEPVSVHKELEENCAGASQDIEADDNKTTADSKNIALLRFANEKGVFIEKTGEDLNETPKKFNGESFCPQKSEDGESRFSLHRGQDQQSEKNEDDKENFASQPYSFGGDGQDDKAQYFEDQNPARFELLHSDSNFMFGPRFKTKPHDPTASPIKRSHKKGKDRGQKFFVEDENSQQYNNEEADRKKSLSRLGASSIKKSKSREEFEDIDNTQSQDTCLMRDMSQNDAYLSSQNEFDFSRKNTNEDKDKGSRKLWHSDSFGSNYQGHEVSNWSTVTDGGDNTVTGTVNQNIMEMNPMMSDRQGQDMNERSNEKSNERSNSKSKFSQKSNKQSGESDHKSLQKINEELDLSYSSHHDASAQKSIRDGLAYGLDVEMRRSSDKGDCCLASPIHQVMSTKMIEEEPVAENTNMTIEDLESSQENRVEEALQDSEMKKNSPKPSDAPCESLETTAIENGSQETVTHSENESQGRHLSFMERKLLRIQQENLKAMGDFDFKKTYSKLEKEKMEIKKKEANDENIALPGNRSKGFMMQSEPSPFMSDTKKHYSRLQLEKLKLKTEEKSGEMTPNMTPNIKSTFVAAVSSITRPPLQMIQSEAERDMREMEIQDMSATQKSLVFTPQAGQKKRKYDACFDGEESTFKVEYLSNLKKVKKADENVESLESMLSKSVKKLPKIEIEKLKVKEQEKQEREQELKELSLSMKDAVFKVEVPLSMDRKYLTQSSNSSHSTSDKRIEQGKSSSKRASLTGTTKDCALCGNTFGHESQGKEMTCSHKAHMECYNKMMINKKDCTTCASDKVSKNYLQR